MMTAEYSGLEMKRFRYMLYWFKLGGASSPAARALLVEASRSLRKHISLLYAVLTVNSISIAYMLPADLRAHLDSVRWASFSLLFVLIRFLGSDRVQARRLQRKHFGAVPRRRYL
jgi:hypothetical protein